MAPLEHFGHGGEPARRAEELVAGSGRSVFHELPARPFGLVVTSGRLMRARLVRGARTELATLTRPSERISKIFQSPSEICARGPPLLCG
jgi:hypothetical protein